MDYERAKAIGEVGERRVAEAIRSEAPSLGFRVLDDVLLIDDQTTAQIDHLLIDRFGVLVVETKNYNALLRGSSDDHRWTACYKGARNSTLLNPLRQNDRHREMLHRVLGAYGIRIPESYVQSLIVFAGGNLSHLRLDDADSMRVVTTTEVTDYLRARCGDFQPNPGALDAEQVAGIESALYAADRSGNSAVIQQHAENVAKATARFGDRFRRRPGGNRPAPAASPYASHIPYNQHGRYPDGSHYPSRRSNSSSPLAVLMLLVLLAGAGYWYVNLGGSQAVSQYIARNLMLAPSPTVEAPAVAPSWDPAAMIDASVQGSSPVPDSDTALLRLKEASPKLYKKLANPSSPSYSLTNGLPTYTWQYVEKTANNSVTIREISVTLNQSGQLVGITGGR